MHTCSDRIPACEGPHPPPHLEVCPARHHQEPLTSWMLEARASVWGKLSLAWAVASWAMPLALPSSLLSLWGMPCPHPCSWAGAPFPGTGCTPLRSQIGLLSRGHTIVLLQQRGNTYITDNICFKRLCNLSLELAVLQKTL